MGLSTLFGLANLLLAGRRFTSLKPKCVLSADKRNKHCQLLKKPPVAMLQNSISKCKAT